MFNESGLGISSEGDYSERELSEDVVDVESGDEQQEEQQHPTIRLQIFRHDAKAKTPPEGMVGDEHVRLTPEGRVHASEASGLEEANPEVAVAFGSPRERSVETAMRHMLGKEEEITPDMSLEEMREKVAEEMKVGRKDRVVQELNFDVEGTPEFEAIAMKHYAESKDFIRFIFEDSDRVAEEHDDHISTTYSRMAANIGSLIKKYLTILPRWEQIVSEDPEKYKEFNNEMQRFMGTHQGVTESFLMKVIEVTEGREQVMKFIEDLPSKNGFDFSEGITVILEDEGEEPVVTVGYKDKTWKLAADQLDKIVSDKG